MQMGGRQFHGLALEPFGAFGFGQALGHPLQLPLPLHLKPQPAQVPWRSKWRNAKNSAAATASPMRMVAITAHPSFLSFRF
jgi:hypothetical protein